MKMKIVLITSIIILFIDLSYEIFYNKTEKSSFLRFIQEKEIKFNEGQLSFKEKLELEKVIFFNKNYVWRNLQRVLQLQ